MARLDVSLDIQGRHCLVVGGGAAASDRTAAALAAGARVTVVAAELDPALRQQVADGRVAWRQRAFAPGDLEDVQLVLALSGDPDADHAVAQAAATCRIPCSAPEARMEPQPRSQQRRGQVTLVGAGPGDPGLLTLDGLRALEQAEVILHDRLIPQEMLDVAPAAAERIFVGKQRSQHHYTQDELNALMIRLGREGKRVVRLKGGDPFVFGRGGEEAAALAEAGIDCRVVPGITAASGCATYAGIPLTHRDHAHACQFITAHDRDGLCDHDWAALVRPQQTLVIYMGLLALRGLCPMLVEHGMDPDMPAALIEKGTTPEQRVLVGTIATLPEIAARHEPTSPAVVIVGEVVRLRETLGDINAADESADWLDRTSAEQQ
jgi:uroporphyrin-III C-methyltransferase/precorrin-2 dehydrogenase/sirohydrochlorin ferrochelatase